MTLETEAKPTDADIAAEIRKHLKAVDGLAGVLRKRGYTVEFGEYSTLPEFRASKEAWL